ncbi:MAG: hypothetical protein Q7S52_04890 [bacterium]|nr:hypothetical protein [bacterium]
MALVLIQSLEQWTAKVDFSELLEIPDGLDVKQEEKNWFAQGGGEPESFVDYLVARGAKKVGVAVHVINYM